MLRYAIRRILWAVPTILGISVVAFLVSTLIPEPPPLSVDQQIALLGKDPAQYDSYVESRRERSLDLPRFVNPTPRDVRALAEAAVAHLAANDAQAPLAAHQLARVGGAALPYVVPSLDRLAPAARRRVAMALLPIARRMGLDDDARVRDPDTAPVFWTQFWEDRSLEFTAPAVRRSVVRLTRRATDARERDVVEVDTFALGELVAAMQTSSDPDATARLSALASHVSSHQVAVPRPLDAAGARRVADTWARWWDMHRADYQPLEGGERITATLSETRYGRWLLSAAMGRFGTSVRDGEPIMAKVMAHARITLALLFISLFASFGLAVPIGVISARRRGQPVDVWLAVTLFLLHSLPTYFLAEVLVQASRGGWPETVRVVLAIVTMTAAALAALSRYQRASMLDVLGQDYIRTARAKGLSEWRVLLVHGLRNAVLPMVTLAGLQIPVLFGAAIVVEEVFELPGLGYETMRAVESHDASWLVAIVLFTALATTAALIASDVAYGILDPRMRERLLRRRGGAA